MLTAQLNKLTKNQKGFTLIELLVVIGILAILLAIVLIAINPARQFNQANDTKRRSDVQAILNAIGAYAADHKGTLPNGIPTGTSDTNAIEIKSAAGGADLCSQLVPNYISALPQDPSLANSAGVDAAGCTAAGGYSTDYTVWTDNNGKVTVIAPSTSSVSTSTIEISR